MKCIIRSSQIQREINYSYKKLTRFKVDFFSYFELNFFKNDLDSFSHFKDFEILNFYFISNRCCKLNQKINNK